VLRCGLLRQRGCVLKRGYLGESVGVLKRGKSAEILLVETWTFGPRFGVLKRGNWGRGFVC